MTAHLGIHPPSSTGRLLVGRAVQTAYVGITLLSSMGRLPVGGAAR